MNFLGDSNDNTVLLRYPENMMAFRADEVQAVTEADGQRSQCAAENGEQYLPTFLPLPTATYRRRACSFPHGDVADW